MRVHRRRIVTVLGGLGVETEPLRQHWRAGRPRKLLAADVAKLSKLNRQELGDLTYKELAQKLMRRIGFAVSAVTI